MPGCHPGPHRGRFGVRTIGKHWPLILAVVVLWMTMGALLHSAMARTDGHLIYVLDDPYIHMAIAKNFAANGVWGVTKGGFSSSTSSLLWPLLLALIYRLAGPNEVTPFILNVLFATAFLCVIYAMWSRYSVSGASAAAGLLAMVYFAPLSPLVFCGQEHILHCLLAVPVVYLSARVLCEKPGSGSRGSSAGFLLLLLFPMLVMARYESLFILFVVCLLLAGRGRIGYAYLLGGLGVVPVVVYGMLSVSKGWGFLPNPILLKGNTNIKTLKGIAQAIVYMERQIMQNPLMFLVLAGSVILLYMLYRRSGTIRQEPTMVFAILVPVTLMHLAFARVGWFFRYEAYLVSLGMFGAVAAYMRGELGSWRTKGQGTRFALLASVFLVVGLPLLDRAFWSHWQTPRGSQNIYEQQYQMGRFLQSYYEGESVAANDIGAVDYLADTRCLDLYGLANVQVAKAMKAGRYNTMMVADLVREHQVKIAIVYDSWFAQYGGVPTEWVRVGHWTIRGNIVCGSSTVSFYAVDPAEAETLTQNLSSFATELPGGVAQTGAYTELLR